ncbi:RNA polymerase sigma factor [Kribbella sp. GL6]|uniref:RNA polymerase sigma factor n=1 Tax=Kribbella sp. GL6 TaxID=3419765 RepID=UPI003CFDEA8D
MSEPADAVLWDRMRSGDLDAWGVLFDRHAARVYRFCVRFLGGSQDAEDTLSDTYLEVWRSRRSFTVRHDSALPILLAIARRAGQKRLRSARRLTKHDGMAMAGSPEVDDIADQVVADDEAERRRAWLRNQVASLPPQFRDVYELVVYAEMPYDEVCRVLGVPPGTVKSRMARVRQILQGRADAAGPNDRQTNANALIGEGAQS